MNSKLFKKCIAIAMTGGLFAQNAAFALPKENMANRNLDIFNREVVSKNPNLQGIQLFEDHENRDLI